MKSFGTCISTLFLLFNVQFANAELLDYQKVAVGKLSGKLIVQWIQPDLFMFIPDLASPLSFKRPNGTVISPGKMMTDGGSIPRSIWILRNYSPWGFAPAFIVHDWLFTMKQCRFDGYDKLTLEDSGMVMAEIMKTMIDGGKIEAGKYTVISMYEAVVSPFAREYWDKGVCVPVSSGMADIRPIVEFKLDFDK